MSDFYSPPPTGRENAPKKDPKPPLPDGWSAHPSTSYPDRVFYWNCRTNTTFWDLEKVFQTGQGPGSTNHALTETKVQNREAATPKVTTSRQERTTTSQQERTTLSGQESSATSSNRASPNSRVGRRDTIISDYEQQLREIEYEKQQRERKNIQLEEMKRKKMKEMAEKRNKSHNTSRGSDDSKRSSESESSNAPSQKENIRKDLNNPQAYKKSSKEKYKDLLNIKNTHANDRVLEERVKTTKTDHGKKAHKTNAQPKLKERRVKPENKIPAKVNKISGGGEKGGGTVGHSDTSIVGHSDTSIVTNFKIPKRGKNKGKVDEYLKRRVESAPTSLESEEAKTGDSENNNKFLEVIENVKSIDKRPLKRTEDQYAFVSPKKRKNDEGNREENKLEDSFTSEQGSEDDENDDVSWKRSKKKRRVHKDDSPSSKELKTSLERNSPDTCNENYRNGPRSNRNGQYPRSNRSRHESGFSENPSSRKIPPLPRAISPEPPHNSLLDCDNIPRHPKPVDNIPKSRDNSTISMVRDQKVPSWPSNSNTPAPIIFNNLPHTSTSSWLAAHHKSTDNQALSLFSSPSQVSNSVGSSSKCDEEDDYKMDEDEMVAPILTSGLRSRGFDLVVYEDPYDALNYSADSAEFSCTEDSLNTSKVSSEIGSNCSQNNDEWCPDVEVDRPIDTSLTKEVEEEEAMDWEDGPSIADAVGEAHLARKNLEEKGRPEVELDESSSSNSEIASKTSENSVLMVVVDTCVLMSSLAIVEDIRDKFLLNGKKPLLMIPWTVIRELDTIKDRKVDNNKADASARRAIKWIQAALRARHPQMRQQTIVEENKAEDKFKAECGDDRILQYCMVLSEDKAAGNKVLLFTNDRNLENKALINGITAADHENVYNQLSNAGNADCQVKQQVNQDEATYVHIMTVIRGVLYELIEAVFIVEMEEALGEMMWKKVVKIKPRTSQPFWSLGDIIKLFSMHQYAVFSHAYSKQFQQILEELSCFVKKTNSALKLKDTLDFVSKFQNFVDLVEERGKNAEEVNSTKERLSSMQQEINQMLVHGANTADVHEDGDVEDGPVVQLFVDVWTKMEDVCSRLCELFEIPNELTKGEGVQLNLTSPEEVSHLTRNAFGQVLQLGENFLNLLNAVRGSENVQSDLPILVTFLDQLSEIPAVLGENSVAIPKANTRQLLLFVSSQSNTKQLNEGLEFLVILRDLLQKCCQKIESQS